MSDDSSATSGGISPLVHAGSCFVQKLPSLVFCAALRCWVESSRFKDACEGSKLLPVASVSKVQTAAAKGVSCGTQAT